MSDTSALHPSTNFTKFKEIFKPEKVSDVLDDDRLIGIMGETDGWNIYKDFLLKKKEKFLRLDFVDTNGASYEEMGQLFFMARIICEFIDEAVGKVENTKKVLDEQRRAGSN